MKKEEFNNTCIALGVNAQMNLSISGDYYRLLIDDGVYEDDSACEDYYDEEVAGDIFMDIALRYAKNPFILKTDNSVLPVSPKNGKDFKLKEMQDIVGGYVELVRISGDRFMVLNEEGKIARLPVNFRATELYNTCEDFICGDVLVCGNDMIK